MLYSIASFPVSLLAVMAVLICAITCKGSVNISIVPPPGPLQWMTEAYAKGTPTAASNLFGYSVAIDGDTAVIGALNEGVSGAAYVLKRSDGVWTQEAYLKAVNADLVDNFGSSVAVSGDTLVVGATGEDSNQQTISNGTAASGNNAAGQSGAAYVYRRSGTTWAQEAYLKAPNAVANSTFGYSTAISGDTIAVGANGEPSNSTAIINGGGASSNTAAPGAGAVYVFKRSGSTWATEAYLKPPNTGASDEFGRAVAIDTDTIIVGAHHEDSFTVSIINGAGGSADDNAVDAGAAYIFRRTGVIWAQEAYFKAPNAEAGDQFGFSVAISGDTVAVGATGERADQFTITNGAGGSSNNSAPNAGAVYVFKRSGVTWSQEAYIKPPNNGSNNLFGVGVSIYGDRLAVGAEQESSATMGIINGDSFPYSVAATNAGAAYVFLRSGVNWVHETYFKAGNTEAGDKFGGAVALSGNTLISGARQEAYNTAGIIAGSGTGLGNGAANSGAAYIFVRKSSP
jgi:hypothetical protein